MNRAAPPPPRPPAPSAPPEETARTATPVPVSPLLPVVLTLVIAALVLAVLFARWFPVATLGPATSAVRFTNVTAESGVRFVHSHGESAPAESPTTLGAGVVVLDFNRDGRPDLFFVNGAAWPWADAAGRMPGATGKLFRNDGGFRFTDVTSAAGLAVPLQGMNATAGDFDGDGFPDLFLACLGANHLFRNRGDGTFEDVTDSAGVGGDDHTWSTAAAWLDLDRDGRPDLIVAHYARWAEDVPLALAFSIAEVGRSYGAPAGFLPTAPSVYRNLGGGRFALQPDGAGLLDRDPQTGRPMPEPIALVPLDANGDGLLDLLVHYHTREPSLFLNLGDGNFRREIRRDERFEGAAAVLTTGPVAPGGNDERAAALLTPLPAAADAEPRRLALAQKSSGAILDTDFGGHFEFFSGGGFAELAVNHFENGRDFAAPPAVLRFQYGHWWPLPTPAAADGNAGTRPLTARGVATADLDADGDDDVIVTQFGEAAQIFRNDQRSAQPWLRLRLVAAHGDVSAAGARVEVHTPRRAHVQTAGPRQTFFAQSDDELVFGLGDDARVRRIVIRWPSGQRQELHPAALNQTLTVREP